MAALITSRFATAERTADVLGVSRARTRQLMTLAQKTLSEKPVKSPRSAKANAGISTRSKARKKTKRR